MKKMSAKEMRNVEGGESTATWFDNGRCYFYIYCNECGCQKTYTEKVWFGYKAGAKYKARNKAYNWLYNHGCY